MTNSIKRVTFATDDESTSPSPIEETSISPTEMDLLWFSQEELYLIKAKNCKIVKTMRSLLQTNAKASFEAKSPKRQREEPELCPSPFLRGLEFKCCLERQRRCYIGNKAVLKASASRKLSPEKLARFSARCTQWAASLAQMEAIRDFYAVYSPLLSADAVVMAAIKLEKLHVRDEDCHSTIVKRLRSAA